MTVWREVQETLYQRFVDQWKSGAAALTPFCFGNEKLDPPNAAWCRFSVRSMPGDQDTLGPPGGRKFARKGMIWVQLFEPPLGGVARLSDLAEAARHAFEGCRFEPHGIRFAAVDISQESDQDEGRWWGVTIQGPFDYEEQR